MIAFLEGVVLERAGAADVVVGVPSGVGYRVMADCRLANVGDKVSLWIHSITNAETGTRLFGFVHPEARDRFVELLSVEGVGPKTAFAILVAGAKFSVAELCQVKGVGKKTAEKIVEQLGASL
jgi:Holliday junction DNA helicase RuvA